MKQQFSFITIIVLFTLFLVGPSIAQQQSSSEPLGNFSDLSLEIVLPKEAFVELEPIPLTFVLSNRTRQPIMGHADFEFTTNKIQLFVTPLGGQKRRIKDLSMIRALVGVSSSRINPGLVIQSKQLINTYLDKYFPQPGTYQIEALFFDVEGKEKIQSNALTLRIISPTGIDSQALDFIRNNASPSHFFNGYEFVIKENALNILEEFASRFEESSYSDYAAFLLGETLFVKKEYNKALRHLSKLATKSNFVFSEKVADYLDKTQKKLREISGTNK